MQMSGPHSQGKAVSSRRPPPCRAAGENAERTALTGFFIFGKKEMALSPDCETAPSFLFVFLSKGFEAGFEASDEKLEIGCDHAFFAGLAVDKRNAGFAAVFHVSVV